MDIAWVLVAHRSGAKLFEHRAKEMKLLQEIPNEQIETQASGPEKSVRDAVRLSDQATRQFIRHLAVILEEGRVHKRYSKLVLVAEPRLLGELRSALTPQTASLISTTQVKDFARMETHEIQEHLKDFAWPSPRRNPY